ncbi:tetratricopeptide repeat protein [uncultured Lamprocystis sp.]|jgi:TPR repeat protein|uniref:tetratricopeptide repeat protein n=1 Tax=uncultured Lamprocystis sp. TaxID=543132 RepID=UPI0025CDDD1C|nr:tetratricopeptide repeat protein [uncultured Lamprocystis sp.]
MARLQAFLDCDGGFAWMPIAGVGGQGKSRLGYELTLRARDQGWRAGLLESGTDLEAFDKVRASWQPAQPHLIVLDCVVGRETKIGPIIQTLARRAGELRKPVRLLLLERQRWDRGGLGALGRSAGLGSTPGVESEGRADWFIKLAERHDGNDPALDATRFEDGVLELKRLEPSDLIAIVRRIAELEGAETALPDPAIAERLQHIDSTGRPLYAYFLGQVLAAGGPAGPGWSRDDLLDATLERDRGSRWQQFLGESAPCLGDNSPAERIAVIATIAGGIDCAAATRRGLIPHADADTRRRALVLTDGSLSRGVGGPAQLVPALQPDLLGEWFVLSAFAEGLPVAEVLNLAWRQAPDRTAAFLQRISQDFPDRPVTAEQLEREPPDGPAADALARVASAILVNLYRAHRPFPQPMIAALTAAAQAGDGTAMSNLGFCYERGQGVDRDPDQAVDWYRKGAAVGDGLAMANLGVCYDQGRGVERDPVQAADWFRKGAAVGDGLAMSNLGACYNRGLGVERDPALAAVWYRAGAEAGDETAAAGLRRLQPVQALLAPRPEPDELIDDWPRQLAEGLGRADWLDTPPIPGDWEDLAGADAATVLARLWPQLRAAGLGEAPAAIEVQCLRRVPLACYCGCSLADIQLQRPGEVSPVLVSALVSPGGAALLDGTLALLHTINPDLLALDDDEATVVYLRFFCAFVRGEDGPFQILDDIQALPMDGGGRAALPQDVRQAPAPPRALDGDLATDGWRRFDACVLYSNALFRATFKVLSTGMIEIEDNQPIATDLPIRTRRYDGIFRTPLSAPADA